MAAARRSAAACLALLAVSAPLVALAQQLAPVTGPQPAHDAPVHTEAAVPGKKLADQLLTSYLSNAQLGTWMDEFINKCPGIAKKYSVGKSAGGQEFWALEISDKPGVVEAEPYFKYIANMHGDETSGRMLLPMFAEWLCANNGKDSRATRLVRDAHIFLMPTMNPDGFDARRRYNRNGVDLNRNFPDPWRTQGDLRQPGPGAAPETRAVMAFTLSKPFVASANMHEGAVVVNYPFDAYYNPSQSSGPHLAPDDATFKFLSHLYADKHAYMSTYGTTEYPYRQEFPGGITNGAEWYEITGGMQDWNYMAAGDMELTLELSANKFPSVAELPKLWKDNQDALIALPLAAALGGARGTVTAAGSGAPLAATLYVKGAPGASAPDAKPVPFFATKQHGFFARPLAPGRYTLVATAPGYQPAEATVTVPADGSGAVAAFSLKRASRKMARGAAAAAASAAA